MSIKEAVKPYIPSKLRPFPKFFLRELQVLRAIFDEKFKKPIFSQALPPPRLRYRVHGVANARSFIDVGQKCAQDIIKHLEQINKPLSQFREVLDFGCGCGRTLLHLEPYKDQLKFSGCDINPPLIKWCQKHIPWVKTIINNSLPPTPYKDEQFDLIYAISVFTHLDENYQFKWLKELNRITKKGAILLISIHGPSIQGRLKRNKTASLVDEEGFHFEVEGVGLFKQYGLPDFYQTAFHTQAYIQQNWSKYFKVRSYLKKGMNNDQDLVILEKL